RERPRVTPGGVAGPRLPGVRREAADNGLFESYRKVVETGEPIVWDAFDYQAPFTSLPIQRVLDLRVAKLDDGVLITWRNVTERLRTQQQLIEVRAQAEIFQRIEQHGT